MGRNKSKEGLGGVQKFFLNLFYILNRDPKTKKFPKYKK